MILPFSELAELRKKHPGKRIVAASGVFDLLHTGHVYYLRSLKEYGDITVALIKPDARIKRYKHPNRPIIPEADRAYMVDALKGVDYVVVGSAMSIAPAKVDAMYKAFFTALAPDTYVSTNKEWSKLATTTTTKVKILPRIKIGHFGSTTAILTHIHTLDSF